METMPRSDFEKWKFVGSLPSVLAIHVERYPLAGAEAPDFSMSAVIYDDRILMRQVFYTTPKRIHGLLHYNTPTQLLFMGYECSLCGEVFLVPDSVNDVYTLGESMRHGCAASPANRSAYEVRPRPAFSAVSSATSAATPLILPRWSSSAPGTGFTKSGLCTASAAGR